jgi:hypothetical protein
MQIFGYECGTTYGWRASARFATEIIICLVVSSPLLFAIACLVALDHGLNRPELVDVPGKLLVVAGLVACLWLALFFAFWLFDLTGGRQRVASWSTTPPVIRACLVHMLWMVAAGLFLAMAIGFTEVVPLWTTANGPANILLATISVIVVTIPHVHWIGPALFGGSILFMSLVMRFERRQHETWGGLDIGDDTRTAD